MERWVPHILGLFTPLMTIGGLILGGWWMGTTVFVALVLYPIIDTILGTSDKTDPLQEGRAFNIILHTHAILVPIVICCLLWRVNLDPSESLLWLGVLSTGLSSGASGIITAHELGHRSPRSISWWLARLNLLGVLYLHFTVEHNYTHHKHWARSQDPTFAPWRRSVYFHFLRTVPLQLIGAWKKKPKDTTYSLILEILLLSLLYFYSPILALAFIGQAVVAIFLLEFVNYIQHYGLLRAIDERGKAHHAWESRNMWSRWTLLELPLHPSHHLRASTHYQRLDVHDDAPQLPGGYYLMLWIALIPPLFFKKMQISYDLSLEKRKESQSS